MTECPYNSPYMTPPPPLAKRPHARLGSYGLLTLALVGSLVISAPPAYATGGGSGGKSPPPPPTGPTASFNYSVNGLTVNVTSTSTAGSSSIVAWTWTFGDGTGTFTGTSGFHNYASAGTYSIVHTVRDVNGLTSSASAQVIVAIPPSASFVITAIQNLFVSVASTAQAGSSPIISYSWTFGDNTGTFTGTSASHNYGASGTYLIQHTVQAQNGQTSTTGQFVAVTAGKGGGNSFSMSEVTTNEATPAQRRIYDLLAQPLYWAEGDGVRCVGQITPPLAVAQTFNWTVTAGHGAMNPASISATQSLASLLTPSTRDIDLNAPVSIVSVQSTTSGLGGQVQGILVEQQMVRMVFGEMEDAYTLPTTDQANSERLAAAWVARNRVGHPDFQTTLKQVLIQGGFGALTRTVIQSLTRASSFNMPYNPPADEHTIYDFSVDAGAKGQNGIGADPTKDGTHTIGGLYFYEPTSAEDARILAAFDDPTATGSASALRVTPTDPPINNQTFGGTGNWQMVIVDKRSKFLQSNHVHVFYRSKFTSEKTVIFLPASLATQ